MENGTGVLFEEGGLKFQVWAPKADLMELVLFQTEDSELKKVYLPMDRSGEFWEVFVPGAKGGCRYLYRIDGEAELPDPASRCQPDGVHKPSQVVDTTYNWTDHNWKGISLADYVFYELHIGTFTSEGTFEAVIPHLPRLKELGITAIEIMPIAAFPGKRNWGYDGVYPYAVQSSYGGVEGLAQLVNAAHSEGLAVVLDVVYNHLGPEGNYLSKFGPYFTDCFKTPWGSAVNFSEAYSDRVREYFVNNAVYWLKELHIDALRLDACHAIHDTSAYHIFEEIVDRVSLLKDELSRNMYLIAETDSNNPRYVTERNKNGYGFDCQWLDDFHHALYTLLPGSDHSAYCKDYGALDQLVKAYREGYVYSGEYCPTRKHKHGKSSSGLTGERFMVFLQNHDQIGNRPGGERITDEISFECYKLAAAAYILSPYLPMLFMGEEYGETHPFLYFVDHSDEQLINAIREGRKKDFDRGYSDDKWHNPQDPETMRISVLSHDLSVNPIRVALYNYYKKLLRLRKELPVLRKSEEDEHLQIDKINNLLTIKKISGESGFLLILNFADQDTRCHLNTNGKWSLVLDSASSEFLGQRIEPAPQYIENDENLEIPVRAQSAIVYKFVK